MGQQHPQFLTAERLYMHRTVKARPHHLRDAPRIVAIRLVDQAEGSACLEMTLSGHQAAWIDVGICVRSN
jgi:hypothetical protein